MNANETPDSFTFDSHSNVVDDSHSADVSNVVDDSHFADVSNVVDDSHSADGSNVVDDEILDSQIVSSLASEVCIITIIVCTLMILYNIGFAKRLSQRGQH